MWGLESRSRTSRSRSRLLWKSLGLGLEVWDRSRSRLGGDGLDYITGIYKEETTTTSRTNDRNLKKFIFEVMTKFFNKNSEKNAQILKSRVSVSNFKSRVPEFLMKSRSRSFNQVSVSRVMISTTPLLATAINHTKTTSKQCNLSLVGYDGKVTTNGSI